MDIALDFVRSLTLLLLALGPAVVAVAGVVREHRITRQLRLAEHGVRPLPDPGPPPAHRPVRTARTRLGPAAAPRAC
ncbi:hypothetical protein [Streptomyces sulphureus]|uniref:hypothetical protein n=1 Tax=Streptomyces sulphureus TaxID=47758 RepID=UPI00036BB5B2|nr:hypothetical protein [Streptomyces sulphureus]